MKTVLAVIFALLVVECASAAAPLPSRGYTIAQYEEAKRKAKSLSSSPDASRYRKQMVAFYPRVLPRVMGACGAIRSPVSLVVRIGNQGRIESAMVEDWTPQSACVAHALEGLHAPTPPQVPYFQTLDIKSS